MLFINLMLLLFRALFAQQTQPCISSSSAAFFLILDNSLPLSQCSLSHKGRILFTISLHGCQNISPVIKVLLRRNSIKPGSEMDELIRGGMFFKITYS